MFMENVDGDHYFLSLIALKQFSSVTVQFLRWIVMDIFTLIKSVKLIVLRVQIGRAHV